jgi:hypothetical protein
MDDEFGSLATGRAQIDQAEIASSLSLQPSKRSAAPYLPLAILGAAPQCFTHKGTKLDYASENRALAQLAPRVQWEHSYVASDKTFCIYLADDASVIQKHARLSGFAAGMITEINGMIDPTT